MRKRTKALSIPTSVKEAVAKRDSFDGWPCCLLCGTPAPSENMLAFSNAHFVPRSKGGLGIEQNTLTLCWPCHQKFDQTSERSELRGKLRGYLIHCYPEWDESKVTYRKD